MSQTTEFQIPLSPAEATKYIKLLSDVEKWDRLDAFVAGKCQEYGHALPPSNSMSIKGNILTISNNRATESAEIIPIRTFEFASGLLHLLRDGTMSDAEVADYYAHKGPLLSAKDDEMSAKRFYALEDFNDL